MSRNEAAFRIGDYFLGKRRGSDVWCACWFDARTRQVVRRSLGTSDLRAAQIELARFVTQHGELRDARPGELTVAQVLERYWHHHAKNLPSADQARIASRILLEHLEGSSIAELTPQRQQRLVAKLAATGRSSSYISRILSVLRAALLRAHKLGEVTSVPFIADVPKVKPITHTASDDEIAAFWQAIEDHHLRMFVVLALNTAGRPNALLQLSRWQIDLPARLRIPTRPAGHSNLKPATYSALKPACVPI